MSAERDDRKARLTLRIANCESMIEQCEAEQRRLQKDLDVIQMEEFYESQRRWERLKKRSPELFTR